MFGTMCCPVSVRRECCQSSLLLYIYV
jgi:hypothetical protein